jgi:hypothetical protein
MDDGVVKSSEFVMPDLIWHPEHIATTGFRFSASLRPE